MTKLSVNINKIATLRNSRGGNVPNLLKIAKDLQQFGAQGITIHPRPDERHIKYQDAYDLKQVVHTEYNIEGNPVKKFMDLVLAIKPTQVTLVPDADDALTSNAGWNRPAALCACRWASRRRWMRFCVLRRHGRINTRARTHVVKERDRWRH